MTCSRDVDIIKHIYSKWSNTDLKPIYKDKLKKKLSHYQITQPEINKNLYDKLKLKTKSLELDGTCYI